jgi:conjugative transfer region protein TrbK
MSGPGTLNRLLLVTAAGVIPVLLVAACAIQLRGDGDNPPARTPASWEADPLAAKLEHCRTVAYEQTAELEACRRIWTESHRRFLGQKKEPAVDRPRNAEMPSPAQPGDRGGLPQGWTSITTPNSE